MQPAHLGLPVAVESALLSAAIVLGAVGAGLVLALALAALTRRRTRSYLLVTGAVAALLARPLVGGATAAGWLSGPHHHLLEHGLDVVLVALVVAAVYHARTVDPSYE